MTEDLWSARLSQLVTVFTVFAVVLTLGGFVYPSGANSTDASLLARPGYHWITPTTPTRLVVPSIRLSSPVLPIEVSPAGVLDPPADVHRVGWWKRSAKPGATRGQTVVTGHTVHTGGGVMNELGKLRPGARIRLVTAKGTVVYRTTKVFDYSRAQVAKNNKTLFSQTRATNRLVLITCTDWNGSGYDSNIIVFATPLGVKDQKRR